jgi:uncharacterized protein YjbI with pentapeptide repeats
MVASARKPRRPPHLPDHLEVVDEPVIEDETELVEVAIGGDLSFTEASSVEIAACRVRARFTGAHLDRARLVDSLIIDSDFSCAELAGVSVTRVEFRGCRLSGLVADLGGFADVAFVDCRLDGANLRMTRWSRSAFAGCDLREADLSGADLGGANLVRCDLRGATVDRARLHGCRLHHSQLDGVRGGEALRGVAIASDQIVPVALALFGALGIVLDDDGPDDV